ncbi:uncharacterized protein LDX57_010543 [Aspergillus melleus]|uniref:uncharacterized protein n=1 Tax=Aspergillus melleus TaxID=138277 RepID=UPI001E8D3813|nr:uncharacterized protein LDX57_010543 [Aspergillus melleus]KAH8432911.1 hypothetical protein LDX57_010543 [Aspergillus melleus]
MGLFARTVPDLQLALEPFFTHILDTNPFHSPTSLQGTKVAFLKTHVWPKAGPGTQAAWNKAQEILTNTGAILEDAELHPDFSSFPELTKTILSKEAQSSFQSYMSSSTELLDASIVQTVENGKSIRTVDLLQSYNEVARLRPIWDSWARQYDVILTPSVPDEAPRGLDWTGDSSFCSMWTLLHVPVLNIPIAHGENGLPIGLSMVGPRYGDMKVLRAARLLEEVLR